MVKYGWSTARFRDRIHSLALCCLFPSVQLSVDPTLWEFDLWAFAIHINTNLHTCNTLLHVMWLKKMKLLEWTPSMQMTQARLCFIIIKIHTYFKISDEASSVNTVSFLQHHIFFCFFFIFNNFQTLCWKFSSSKHRWLVNTFYSNLYYAPERPFDYNLWAWIGKIP